MSFGAEGALAAQDVASAPFLPGGLWIYFACFGAGTPRTSAYHHWLDMLAQHGMADLGPVSATLRGLDQGGGFVSGLAKAALAARVDGELRDLNRPFEGDSQLALVTARDEKDALDLVRHDFAHILAEAVQKLYPGTQITFGPATDDGFYYDFAPAEGNRTSLTLRNFGYGHGDEWAQNKAYFEKAWPAVMASLEKLFAKR